MENRQINFFKSKDFNTVLKPFKKWCRTYIWKLRNNVKWKIWRFNRWWKRDRACKRTCKNEFNSKYLYSMVLENWLLNLMNFLRLRADSHAQYEIRVYADIMLDTVKKWVPITYDAFMDYRVGGTEVSAKGKLIIQKLIKGENVDVESSGLSKREWNELMTAFDLKDNLI